MALTLQTTINNAVLHCQEAPAPQEVVTFLKLSISSRFQQVSMSATGPVSHLMCCETSCQKSDTQPFGQI